MTAPRRRGQQQQQQQQQSPPNLTANPIVDVLARGLAAAGPQGFANAVGKLGGAQALAESADVPKLVSFAGYLGATITHPASAAADATNQWCVLYLDWDLHSWLLIEAAAIVRRLKLDDNNTTEDPYDVIWVRADGVVSRGSGSLSTEAQFLSGDFTRAGDFDAGPTGGTLSASTGVFCEARSPGCCRGCTAVTRR
jgi:hypothetical protein